MEQFIHQIDGLVRADWLNTAISVVVILGITAIVARLLTRFLRRVLHFNEQKALPSSSIFVNIARAAVWVTGICIMLSTSFNVNVSAAITALGIGGIAISLGFQDTLSNLIGGLQLSLLRIIKPGDNISVGSESGVVRDVTWRHTTIKHSAGEEISSPNAIINKTALVQLPPPNQTGLPVVVTTNGEDLTRTASAIEKAADEAASAVGKVKKKPELMFSEITGTGFKGSLAFTMADARNVSKAKDAVLRAIAPLTRPSGQGGPEEAKPGEKPAPASATPRSRQERAHGPRQGSDGGGTPADSKPAESAKQKEHARHD